MRERALLCTVTPCIARSAGSSTSSSARSWACTAFIPSSIRSRRVEPAPVSSRVAMKSTAAVVPAISS